jgi:hypothetical protein
MDNNNTENKLNQETNGTQEDTPRYHLVKYTSAVGRPSVEHDQELQKEYISIYIDKIINGMTEQQIADTRQISRPKVKKALMWCRNNNTVYTSADDLIDAINTLDYRMLKLVKEQDKNLRQKLAMEEDKFDTWNKSNEKERQSLSKPDIRVIESFHRLILLYEDRILDILEKKFNLQKLFKKEIELINPDNSGINKLIEETEIVSIVARMFTPEDRAQVITILDKYVKPVNAENY